MKYIGYHGTSRSAGDKIIAQQKFLDTTALDSWLGKGVYFFEDVQDAEWWCSSGSHAHRIDHPMILQADLSPARVVDLLGSFSDVKQFRSFCDLVKGKCARLPNGKPRANFMSLAVNLMAKKRRPDMILAGFYQNRKQWYPMHSQQAKQFPIVVAQIQYCILNHDCIQEIREYRKGEESHGDEGILG